MNEWTEELKAKAKALCESGDYSFADVSRELGYAKSRNAIISCARRYGWKIPRSKPAPQKIEHQEPYSGFLGLQLQELDRIKGQHDCRYPAGDGPFLFCGSPAKEDSSYCPEQHALCYERPTPAKVRERAKYVRYLERML